MPIRLSPTATSGSVRPCSWTFTSVAIFGSHNRSQSSSDFSLTMRPVPATWRRLAGATVRLPPLSGGGRAVPLRKSSWRLALPQVQPWHRIDGGNGHGALAHAARAGHLRFFNCRVIPGPGGQSERGIRPVRPATACPFRIRLAKVLVEVVNPAGPGEAVAWFSPGLWPDRGKIGLGSSGRRF